MASTALPGPISRLSTAIGGEVAYVAQLITTVLFSRPIKYAGLIIPWKGLAPVASIKKSLLHRGYERAELDMIQARVRPSDVVLEFGAGLGVVTAALARITVGAGRVVAYEANTALIDSANRIAQANGVEIELRNRAIGLEAGPREFFFADNFLSSSNRDRQLAGRSETITQDAIAVVLAEVKPTVMVCDIEGAECEIFTVPMPASLRAIYIETHPHIVGEPAISQLVKTLLEQGFELLVDTSFKRVLAFERPCL